MLTRRPSKLKILLRILGVGFVGYFLLICYFLWSLGPTRLLVGATSHSYSLPSSIFRFYIRIFKAVPSTYHTDNGLPAIQFVANRRGEDSQQNMASIEMIKYLLRNGADVNEASSDKLGLTAMHAALLNKDLQLAEVLFQNGADPNALAAGEKFKGMTPLRFAKELTKNANDPRFIAVEDFIKKNGGHE